MHKHTIVVDVRMINSSGIGTYLKNILPIVATKFNLKLLGNKKEIKKFAWTKNFELIPFEAKIYSPKEQILFPKIIPETNLFWCPHFNVPLFSIKAKNIVTTIHDVNHLAIKNKKFSAKKKYAKKLFKNAVAKSIKIITVSDFSKNEILKFTNAKENQIKVIYNGVNQNLSNQYEIATRIEIPKKYLLFVGNVKPHKNLITLLKAYLNLPEEIKKEYKIVVLGKNEGFITSDEEIFKFIKQNGLEDAIHFTGYLDDALIPSLYKNATIFIFPSNYEGFGLPLLESMACNTPVICSDIPSSKEIAGEAALYFEKNNHTNLSEKIKSVLSNEPLKNQLINKGKKRIKLFDWKNAANEHIKIFQEILDNQNYE
ncbi:glycosyltransferase family 1 protein [Aureibaculum sp. 2210JD6-5]|uniref:glycosyltransferase family 4 protein n=1 Tax=Aureibaculum sp. 2210JD6-5 TaxID=3103957 RepID=UPI002AAD0BB0|nr:glycosyltransferase family 1 protein [Aureibaculum sp. 2210JD6-5]MDY7396189.1 glycosyltransferase family 1 protein [Aureibaculum sp. 2210JD6-5]